VTGGGKRGWRTLARSCRTEEKRERGIGSLHRVSREKAGERQRCHLQALLRAHLETELCQPQTQIPTSTGRRKEAGDEGGMASKMERGRGVRKIEEPSRRG